MKSASLMNATGSEPGRTAEIRGLNDELRRSGRGGRVMLTAGVAALPAEELAAITYAVAAFDAFGPDNDPYGEHDFGAVELGGHRVFWKIDAYDRTLRFASPDPTDSSVTVRVMTIMLATEY